MVHTCTHYLLTELIQILRNYERLHALQYAHMYSTRTLQLLD